MKIRLYYILFLACFILGCGEDTNAPRTNAQVAQEIIQKYDFQTVGNPTTEDFALPQELTDANWGLKEMVCEEAGYNLTPYAGQSVSIMQYPIVEKCEGVPLSLWILIKDGTCICAYTTTQVGSHGPIPGVWSVNNACIQ